MSNELASRTQIVPYTARFGFRSPSLKRRLTQTSSSSSRVQGNLGGVAARRVQAMSTVSMSLAEIGDLVTRTLFQNGCDAANTEALVRTVVAAERDGSLSHGLFRVPGYVASLRSGKVNGKAAPKVNHKTPVIVSVHGDNGYAPLAIERGVPALTEVATKMGNAGM